MRTYWAVVRKGGTDPVHTKANSESIPKPAVYLQDVDELPDGLETLEVAVVPAAALKRLVEAVEKMDEGKTCHPDCKCRSCQVISALSEWKGGAE